jgi:SAM-dependent methyltransferase
VPQIERTEGRRLFGSDPAAYDLARPGHADRVYEILVARCGLRDGSRVLEIGPGTGQATRRLLELGATVVAIEPDAALAAYLPQSLGREVDVRVTSLEDAVLPAGTFALAVAASSFHWVDEPVGLRKILDALRPGGWFGMWWTLFGDREHPDAFMTAASPLLEGLHRSPTAGEEGRPPFARDSEARLAAVAAAGFEDASYEVVPWDYQWNTAGIRALYGSFSPIARLDEERRTEILDAVARLADEHFGGRVGRTLLTTLYVARKPS